MLLGGNMYGAVTLSEHPESKVVLRNIKCSLLQLEKVLKSLEKNKSRDPHGLFKPGVVGQDLLKSLLMLFDKVKETMTIPTFM